MGDEYRQQINLTASLAHLILCGTSGWAIKNSSWEFYPFAFSCYAYLLGHGVLGLIRYSNPYINRQIRSTYDRSTFLTRFAPVAIFNSQIYLNAGQPKEFVYWGAATVFIPILTSFISGNFNNHIINLLNMGHILSLGFISMNSENYWIFGLVSLNLINFFGLEKLADRYDVPKVDLFTVGLCFFTIFTINCL